MERNPPIRDPEETPKSADNRVAARGRDSAATEKKSRDPEQAPRGRTIPHLF